MENSINGEIYNLKINEIKEIFNENFTVLIKDKSTEEIYIENDTYFIDIYDNSMYMENSFLIGGVFRGEFYDAVIFINKISEFLLNKKVAFELNLERGDRSYLVKYKSQNE
jgi:hypothetical protein